MMIDTIQQLGISGSTHGYDVVVIGDQITVTWDGTRVTRRQVPNPEAFVGKARSPARLGTIRGRY